MTISEKEQALEHIIIMRANIKQRYDKCKYSYIPIINNPNIFSDVEYKIAKADLNNTLDLFYNFIIQNIDLLEETINSKKELPKNETK